jgi:hypothetical protein
MKWRLLTLLKITLSKTEKLIENKWLIRLLKLPMSLKNPRLVMGFGNVKG